MRAAATGHDLLRTAGLHGHRYAIDAMLCATALQHPGRVTILTSDVDDIDRLTDGHPRSRGDDVTTERGVLRTRTRHGRNTSGA